MKASGIASAIALSASALAATVPSQPGKVDYAGHQSLRITIPEDARGIEEQIEAIAARVLDPGHRGHVDAVVAADKVDAVKSLTSDVEVLIEDVGAAIAEEGDLVSTYAGEVASPAPHLVPIFSHKRVCPLRKAGL